MVANRILPLEVDEVRVTTVVDNCIDMLLVSDAVAQRYPTSSKWLPLLSALPNPIGRDHPVAEHGFSALINVSRGSSGSTVLFDTGVSQRGLLHNIDALDIDLAEIQALVLSHGHADHALGLPGLVDRLGPRSMPLVLHPEAYLDRKVVLPNGYELQIPAPKKSDFVRDHIEVVEETGPSMLVEDMILVSGEVARRTEFEKGFPIHFAERNGSWEPDPLIMDDQCAIMNLKGKGLVIITGCGHAGIINILRNAQMLTGIERVHAVIGGFHLSGGLFEPIIGPTVSALQQIGPRYVVPGHCTGWSATHQIARALPEAFLPSSVGTEFNFSSDT